MAETKTETQQTLIVSRVFNAPIKDVFNAWADPAIIAQWFGPVGFTVASAQTDLRVGGKYQISLAAPDGQTISHRGEYVVIDVPAQLVFTWVLEDQACGGSQGQCADTLVSIQFSSVDDATELTLIHEQLPNKAAFEGHMFGWSSSLDSLKLFIEQSK